MRRTNVLVWHWTGFVPLTETGRFQSFISLWNTAGLNMRRNPSSSKWIPPLSASAGNRTLLKILFLHLSWGQHKAKRRTSCGGLSNKAKTESSVLGHGRDSKLLVSVLKRKVSTAVLLKAALDQRKIHGKQSGSPACPCGMMKYIHFSFWIWSL